MINAVSSVSFRGDVGAKKDLNSLINDPGKFSSAAPAQTAAQQQPKADEAILSNKPEKEKNNTGKIIAGVVAALALVWIGLGYAVGRKGSQWTKIENPEGITQKCKNFFYDIGESAVKAYDNTLGKWFGKKAEDATEAAENAAEGAAK